jgi:peptidoglycan pentaglycine glycine transferase (the first glycine)
MTQVNEQEWDEFIDHHPEAHILQTSAWGRLKSAFGWKAIYLIENECGAMLLVRRLMTGIALAYLPKGPVGDDLEKLKPAFDAVCRKERVVFLKIEPDGWEGTTSAQNIHTWGIPSATVQPRRTIVVSLEGSEEHWLGRMKQKTRYNIRLAEKKGVAVRPSQDWQAFERLVEATGKRDGFRVHAMSYYRKAYELFNPSGRCELLMAYQGDVPLAAVMVFALGERAWYFYGASADEGRNLMPTYLLQWEAMRWAGRRGCKVYDLWGVPDESDATLEDNFETRSDGLWGVYRFKRGFGGESRRCCAALDFVYNPLLYKMYRLLRGGQAQEING